MFIVKLIFLKELNPKTPQIAQIPLPKIALAPFCPLEQRQVNQCLIETRPPISINDKIVLNLIYSRIGVSIISESVFKNVKTLFCHPEAFGCNEESRLYGLVA
jgi:hypothetical protein